MQRAIPSPKRPMPIFTRLALWLVLGMAPGLLAVNVANAADPPPLYRYALDWWQPDPYQIMIFHRGELGREHQALAGQIDAAMQRGVNANLSLIDMDGEVTDELRAVFEAAFPNREVPAVVVRYPLSLESHVVYSGALTRDTVSSVMDSPIRKQIQQRILDGHTAVWLLLEGKSDPSNDDAFAKLRAGLERSEKELKLNAAAIREHSDFDRDNRIPLNVKFSAIRVPRDNANERFLSAMLRGIEADLAEYKDQAIAVPVFARGRALFALTEEVMTAASVFEANRELLTVARSSVKSETPGSDLLFNVAWSDAIGKASKRFGAKPPDRGQDNNPPVKPVQPPDPPNDGKTVDKAGGDGKAGGDTKGDVGNLPVAPDAGKQAKAGQDGGTANAGNAGQGDAKQGTAANTDKTGQGGDTSPKGPPAMPVAATTPPSILLPLALVASLVMAALGAVLVMMRARL